jgi:hypothetical protein
VRKRTKNELEEKKEKKEKIASERACAQVCVRAEMQRREKEADAMQVKAKGSLTRLYPAREPVSRCDWHDDNWKKQSLFSHMV